MALVQYSSVGSLDDGVQGVLSGLADRGYTDGGKIRQRKFNAAADVAMAKAIAREVTSGDFGLIVTISTNSLQTVANANQSAHPVGHVFGVVSDPYAAEIGRAHV